METNREQRTFRLSEVVRAGRLAEATSEGGARLRSRPDLQRLGHGALIEVRWQDGEGEPSFDLVEVAPDSWGGLEVKEANILHTEFVVCAAFRVPDVPTEGWRHTAGCDCPDCRA